MTDVLNGMVDFAMLSRELHEEEREKGAVDFPVGRDAVIPVLSAENPLLPQIRAHGITAGDARKIWVSGEYTTWGQLLGTDDPSPIHVYTRSDACGAAQTFAAWFDASQEDLGGTAVYGDPGITKAVTGDRFGIGFNNMAYAYDSQDLKVQPGLAILPIDIDADGSVSPSEDIYGTRASLADDIDISRGDVIVTKEGVQPAVGQDFAADVCWFRSSPLVCGKRYTIRHATQEVIGIVKQIDYKVDIDTQEKCYDVQQLTMNDIARVHLKTASPLVWDPYRESRAMGSLIFIDASNDTVGAGMIAGEY